MRSRSERPSVDTTTEWAGAGRRLVELVVWMVLTARHSVVAQGLATLALLCYAWFGLSTLALAVGPTLLAFRLEPVLATDFGLAGVLGLVEVMRSLPRLVPGPYVRSATTVAGVLALAAGLSLVQAVPRSAEAYDDYYPSGRSPLGAQAQHSPKGGTPGSPMPSQR